LGLAACAHQPAQKIGIIATAQVGEGSGDAAGAANAPSVEASDVEPSARQSLVQSIPSLKPVHFDYDKAFLTDEDKAVLRANSEWLDDHKEVKVQVTGHCDQRGTTEYNLALGQRRAQAVRDFYKMLGVSGIRVATISYGKEMPLCQVADEACWSRDRRAETLEMLPQAVGRAR